MVSVTEMARVATPIMRARRDRQVSDGLRPVLAAEPMATTVSRLGWPSVPETLDASTFRNVAIPRHERQIERRRRRGNEALSAFGDGEEVVCPANDVCGQVRHDVRPTRRELLEPRGEREREGDLAQVLQLVEFHQDDCRDVHGRLAFVRPFEVPSGTRSQLLKFPTTRPQQGVRIRNSEGSRHVEPGRKPSERRVALGGTELRFHT